MVLAVALAFTAVLTWIAVARFDHVVDLITRPTFTVLLAGLAWSLAAQRSADGAAEVVAEVPGLVPVLGALGLHLVVDLLLLTATVARYLLALGASVLANVAWGWAMLAVPGREGIPWWALVAVPVLAVLHGLWGRDVVRYSGRQRGAVFLTLVSLAGLVLVAAWQGDRTVLAGCALLLVSHLVLGHDRFVLERRWAPVLTMVAYHAALALLVTGLLG